MVEPRNFMSSLPCEFYSDCGKGWASPACPTIMCMNGNSINITQLNVASPKVIYL